MACRMLVAAGKLPLARLLDDFRLMALNQNEEHEYRHHPDHANGDGWGVVTGRWGRLEWYRSVMACWQDPRFTDLHRANADFMLLHARRASPGMAIRYEFTHPFHRDGWYFSHNGTIYDFQAGEMSDAQQLFALILENLRRCGDVAEATRAAAGFLQDYSALNFMLFKDNRVYVLCMYGRRGEHTPNYFTIKYLQREDYVVVSSERLPGCGGEWREMGNGTLLRLTLSDRRIDVCQV
jgi:predicted glutamine amidotransferase